MSVPESSKKITRSSKSNLALAFFCLPPARRRAMTTLYAFCRVVDDIADEPTRSPEQKRRELDGWIQSITVWFPGEPPLAPELREVIKEYNIPTEHFYDIIAGVGTDIRPGRFQNFEEMRLYCHRVASAVGLASIEIFGYKNPDCKKYAVDLGIALQLTNIIRDVAQDFDNGKRIYLPLGDLDRFDYSEQDLADGLHNRQFLALMQFQAARAESFFKSAADLLPRNDRRSMIPAEIMSGIYHRLLKKIERDQFRVFENRYSLTKAEKIGTIARVLSRSF